MHRSSSVERNEEKSQYVFLKNIFDCIEFKDEKSSFSLNQLELAAKEGLIDKKYMPLEA